MHWFRNIDDHEAERLFAGHEPENGRLDGVARFLAELDRSFPQTSTDSLEASHVAAMVQASELLVEQGDPAAGQVGDAQGVVSRAPASPGWKRTTVGRNLIAHRWAAVAAFSLAALLAFGSAAYAGILPAPIENAVASAAQYVGIGIPGPLTSGHSGFGRAHKLGTAGTGERSGKGVAGRALGHSDAASTTAAHPGTSTSAGTSSRSGVTTGSAGAHQPRPGTGTRPSKARPPKAQRPKAHRPGTGRTDDATTQKAHTKRADSDARSQAPKHKHADRKPRTEKRRPRR